MQMIAEDRKPQHINAKNPGQLFEPFANPFLPM
jgi:hypothetical protein